MNVSSVHLLIKSSASSLLKSFVPKTISAYSDSNNEDDEDGGSDCEDDESIVEGDTNELDENEWTKMSLVKMRMTVMSALMS